MAPPIRLNADRSRDAIRWAIASAVAGQECRQYAAQRWGQLFVERAGVPGADSGDMGVSQSRAEYLAAFMERTALARMPGVRFVAPNVPILTPSDRPTATWVAEGKSIPAGRFSVAPTRVGVKKVGSISVYTPESLDDPRSEGWIVREITAKAHEALDTALFDVTNAGSDSTPASIAYGAPSSPSSGDPAEDVKTLLADFSGDLANAVFITDKNTATRMALFRDTSGIVQFPDLALIGGSILGLPVLVSRHAPSDSSGGSLILADGSSIVATFEDVGFSSTTEAMIELDSAPQGASDTPTAASATRMSLFSAGLVGIKGILRADWKVIRRGGVSFVSGTDY